MKFRIVMLLVIFALLLSGCGASEAALPAHWEEGWTVVAPYLAAEDMEGFDFGESADTLGISGVYYATWTAGEKRDYTNAEGEQTVIFDAQIYVITQEFRSEADAETNLNQWLAREKQSFTCGDAYTLICNGQEFTILPLLSGSEDNPYGSGCAAFALRGSNAICVELVRTDYFSGDIQATLEAFLNCLHYES